MSARKLITVPDSETTVTRPMVAARVRPLQRPVTSPRVVQCVVPCVCVLCVHAPRSCAPRAARRTADLSGPDVVTCGVCRCSDGVRSISPSHTLRPHRQIVIENHLFISTYLALLLSSSV